MTIRYHANNEYNGWLMKQDEVGSRCSQEHQSDYSIGESKVGVCSLFLVTAPGTLYGTPGEFWANVDNSLLTEVAYGW